MGLFDGNFRAVGVSPSTETARTVRRMEAACIDGFPEGWIIIVAPRLLNRCGSILSEAIRGRNVFSRRVTAGVRVRSLVFTVQALMSGRITCILVVALVPTLGFPPRQGAMMSMRARLKKAVFDPNEKKCMRLSRTWINSFKEIAGTASVPWRIHDIIRY